MTRLVAAVAVAAVAIAACRMGEPGDDPRTPANQPVPQIDRKDTDPAPGPALFGKDAG